MNAFTARLERIARGLLTALLFVAWGTAFGANPDNVNSRLEGCRNDGTITLPNGSGQFICPDGVYTSGNLGKGWNELDLVPYRVTLEAGNAAPASQTYTIAVVLDYEDGGKPGYDVISAPTLNTALSSASCTAPVVAPAAAGALDIPGLGGISKSIFRLWTVTQLKNTSCVYDYYGRLALGSHLFPGSSLHANFALPVAGDDDGLAGGGSSGLAVNLTTSGIGASDVSIPVKEIQPQDLAKDMAASQGSDHMWTVVKSPTSANLSFGDVCLANPTTQLPLQITVTWTKSAAIPGGPVTVVTHVYATNPAARVIRTNVTDVIYSGTTPVDTSPTATVDVPANTANYLVLTHTFVAPAGTTDLNDIATATYTDLVTGVPVPGTTQATASATVDNTGPELNASASIADSEVITGTGLTFSVATPTIGSFSGGYVAGTPTTGPVDWGVAGQTASGSVTFDKTVYLNGQTVTSGILRDVATLVGIDGFAATSNVVQATITSSATVALTIQKSYVGIVLGAGEKLVFNFHIDGTAATGYSADKTLTFIGGGPTSDSLVIGGLSPDSYTVNEGNAVFYPAGCNDSSCSLVVALQDPTGAQRTVDLTVKDNIATCAGTASYRNEPRGDAFPLAQVRKITFPATSGNWEFTLYRPDGSVAATATAVAGGPYVDFGVALTEEGTYKVVETLQGGWDLNGASPNDGVDTKTCRFTVDFPQDLTHPPFQCTFTNTQRGMAKVIKTVLNQAPSGTQAFTFQLRQGASIISDGTTLETLVANAANGGVLDFTTKLVPGNTYQLCEVVMPGWQTTLGTFVPGSFMPPDGVPPNPNVDNSILCGNFSVAPGETKQFAIDNSPPPGGRALTIGFWKNWASCKKSSGKQDPVLDQTMAMAEPTGIQVNSFYLHGSTATPNVAPDCAKAVSLLSKQSFNGKQKSSDPLFNMAAQLVAAELNYTAGAYKCPLVTIAIVEANALLTKYGFNGTTYVGKLSAADATKANNLAKRLDDYNNNRPSACI